MSKDISRRSVETLLEEFRKDLEIGIGAADVETIEEYEEKIRIFLNIVKKNKWTLPKKLSREIKETLAKIKD